MNKTSIIAGVYKGTRLQVGRGQKIRPTLARVRKSIFDILSSLSGMSVLDLYAGSGTLGFEALSRGASSVTFVDKYSGAIRSIRQNSLLFDSCNISIIREDSIRFLKNLRSQFDIILADPPYRRVDLPQLTRLALDRLAEGGDLVIESSVSEGWMDECASIKQYGDTQVSFFRQGLRK